MSLFKKKVVEVEPMVLDIDGYKIMTTAQIIDEHKEFDDVETVIRYLYTKDKERDNVQQIGFVGRDQDV